MATSLAEASKTLWVAAPLHASISQRVISLKLGKAQPLGSPQLSFAPESTFSGSGKAPFPEYSSREPPAPAATLPPHQDKCAQTDPTLGAVSRKSHSLRAQRFTKREGTGLASSPRPPALGPASVSPSKGSWPPGGAWRGPGLCPGWLPGLPRPVAPSPGAPSGRRQQAERPADSRLITGND